LRRDIGAGERLNRQADRADMGDVGATEQSRSEAQGVAEQEAIGLLSAELGVELTPRQVIMGDGAYVEVDGVGPQESVLVEVFAHQGPLKGGQRHKIQGDVLKLATLGKTRPDSRLIVAFCDHEAEARVTGWLAYAMSVWGIERHVVDLPEGVCSGLRAAQERQRMVNPAIDNGDGVAIPPLSVEVRT
jgi:hypothetical protein